MFGLDAKMCALLDRGDNSWFSLRSVDDIRITVDLILPLWYAMRIWTI